MQSSDPDLGATLTGERNGKRTTAELAGDLVHQMTMLMHDELELAKVEMTEKGRRAGLGAGLGSGSGLAAIFGLACLTASLVAALSLVMPVWLAALIVGIVYLAVAAVVGLKARSQMQAAAPPVPEETVESLKEDVECLKSHAKIAKP